MEFYASTVAVTQILYGNDMTFYRGNVQKSSKINVHLEYKSNTNSEFRLDQLYFVSYIQKLKR